MLIHMYLHIAQCHGCHKTIYCYWNHVWCTSSNKHQTLPLFLFSSTVLTSWVDCIHDKLSEELINCHPPVAGSLANTDTVHIANYWLGVTDEAIKFICHTSVQGCYPLEKFTKHTNLCPSAHLLQSYNAPLIKWYASQN